MIDDVDGACGNCGYVEKANQINKLRYAAQWIVSGLGLDTLGDVATPNQNRTRPEEPRAKFSANDHPFVHKVFHIPKNPAKTKLPQRVS